MSHPGIKYESIKELLLEQKEKLLIIKINNQKKKNALNSVTYVELTNVLRTAALDDSVSVLAITGVGDFYTAGNDLNLSKTEMDFEVILQEENRILQNLIRAFFDFPKLLIAVVNGPCIGIGMTTAALCDVIYCTDTTYFYTPFTKLGLCPEGCSSYTFPKIFGKSKATEILVLDQKLTALEALKYGFVSDVVTHEQLDTHIWPKIMEFTRLPQGSLMAGKSLMTKACHKDLEASLAAECDELLRRLHTDDFFKAIIEFGQRKSKL